MRQESPINQVDYINATWIQNGHEDVYDDIYEYLANPNNRLIIKIWGHNGIF